eukprot:sb/3475947/
MSLVKECTCRIEFLLGTQLFSEGDRSHTICLVYSMMIAPIGCASSKGLLITHPASPGCSYIAHFNVNNTVVMATELVTMGTGMLKGIRKHLKTSTGSSKSVSNSFTALCPLTCFMKEQSVA